MARIGRGRHCLSLFACLLVDRMVVVSLFVPLVHLVRLARLAGWLVVCLFPCLFAC